MRISVIGGSTVTDEHYEMARELGRQLAARGHEIVCGGRTGVMEAACRGARENDGHTIGILASNNRNDANPYVETTIVTGIGNARNALVVLNGDAAIAVDGSTGTLSEIALALDYGRPVAGLDTHRVDSVSGIQHVDTPAEAIEHVEQACGVDIQQSDGQTDR